MESTLAHPTSQMADATASTGESCPTCDGEVYLVQRDGTPSVECPCGAVGVLA